MINEYQLKDEFENAVLMALAILHKAGREEDAAEMETIYDRIRLGWEEDILTKEEIELKETAKNYQ